jgi:hypothetical protein
MKSRVIALLAATGFAFSAATPAIAELHRFTSADDPTKTFMAQLFEYDAKKDRVTVQRSNGRKIFFPASKLCEDDREWVKAQYEIILIGRNVRIDAKVRHGDRSITKSSGKKQIDSSKYFDVEISNTSQRELSDLIVQYEIHVTQGGEEGVIQGEPESISSLFSGVPYQFETTKVDLKQKIPLSTASGGAGCST